MHVATERGRNYDRYRDGMATTIAHLKSAFPQAGILVVSVGKNVIYKQKRKAHKIDPQIQYCIIQYVGRGLQSTHHRAGEEKAKNKMCIRDR